MRVVLCVHIRVAIFAPNLLCDIDDVEDVPVSITLEHEMRGLNLLKDDIGSRIVGREDFQLPDGLVIALGQSILIVQSGADDDCIEYFVAVLSVERRGLEFPVNLPRIVCQFAVKVFLFPLRQDQRRVDIIKLFALPGSFVHRTVALMLEFYDLADCISIFCLIVKA